MRVRWLLVHLMDFKSYITYRMLPPKFGVDYVQHYQGIYGHERTLVFLLYVAPPLGPPRHTHSTFDRPTKQQQKQYQQRCRCQFLDLAE